MCKMSARIKEKRIEAGLTQEELGEMLGLQKSAIAKYENGRVENIKRSVIQKMAEILNCSPSYLMGWGDEATSTLAAHAESDLTKEEQIKVAEYIEFLKSQRK